jgi:hypothetical protein
MDEENNKIKVIVLKEMERIFVELKGDYMKKPEQNLLQSIQDKISNRIIELEGDELENDQ